MGVRVTFIRAPRGDASQAPPPIGAASDIGRSNRAAREDHTHEGVHRIVAGEGVTLSPASGLGDVTVAARHWRAPVQTVMDLPTTGNEPGDARVVLVDGSIYVWTGSSWKLASASGSGGGGGPGFDDWGALNRLRLGIEQVETTGRPALTATSERYDAFVDDSAVDWSRSSNVEVRYGRLVPVPSAWVGFGDDWARIPSIPTSRQTTRVARTLAPGAFEFGLVSRWGSGTFDAGVVDVVEGYRLREVATEGQEMAGVLADGGFEAGVTGIITALPAAVQPYLRQDVVSMSSTTDPVLVRLSPGGFDYGLPADGIVDPWGRSGGMECGVVGTLAAHPELVQFATGPLAQVQAADGTFEAGLTDVVARPVRRGGAPSAVMQQIHLPLTPARAYLVADADRVRWYVSRDDGVTWTPIQSEQVVDLTGQPDGTRFRVRVDMDDDFRSYVDSAAYGAAK